MYFYTNPEREHEVNALPNAEAFEWTEADAARHDPYCTGDESDWRNYPGWYWWPCFPGCLPDGEPIGPFDSQADAIASAQEN